MGTKLRVLIALVAAATVASILTPSGGAATVTLGPLGPCCFEALPLHYDAAPGETNDVQILHDRLRRRFAVANLDRRRQ